MGPPPLPPRHRKDTAHLTTNFAPSRDGRASSTHSLGRVASASESTRTLLLIYLHGFVGTETSFKSFPAHVHNIVAATLAESHVVHTKIYPRYKTRRDVSLARDEFSKWLVPHESPTTDVILIGHSLGGILAAEVVLLPSHASGSQDYFQHRILGLLAFDTPFLGMHPGIVKSGIASLFRSKPEADAVVSKISQATESATSIPYSSNTSEHSLMPTPTSPGMGTPLSPFASPITPSDPNFNPVFDNDPKWRVHKNKIDRAMYFWNKHSGDLTGSAKSYVTSYVDFGGCLADYTGLRTRHDALLALDEMDPFNRAKPSPNERILRHVNFTNYYSASTGRTKPRSRSTSPTPTDEPRVSTDLAPSSPRAVSPRPTSSGSDTSRIASLSPTMTNDIPQTTTLPPSTDTDNPDPINTEPTRDETAEVSEDPNDDLPPIPPEPLPPPELDTTKYPREDALKLANLLQTQSLSTHSSALKDRQKFITAREKVIRKREEAAAKLSRKQEEAALKAQRQQAKTPKPPSTRERERESQTVARPKPEAPPKDRKFCTLPPKDRNGNRRCWERVYMEGVDEVVAHTTLFDPVTEAYARLVSDTAERIEMWVRQDLSAQALERNAS